MNIEMLKETLATAKEKAETATDNYILENGENPMGCGFAWVNVKRARGNALRTLKEFGFKKVYVGTGVNLWNPSGSFTQDMDAKMAGAEAYARSLREIGIDASAQCRLD